MSIAGRGDAGVVETWFPADSRSGRVGMPRGEFVEFQRVYRKPSNHQKASDALSFYCECLWGTAPPMAWKTDRKGESLWGTPRHMARFQPHHGAGQPFKAPSTGPQPCQRSNMGGHQGPEPQIHSARTPNLLHFRSHFPMSTHAEPQKPSATSPSPQPETPLSTCRTATFRSSNISSSSSVHLSILQQPSLVFCEKTDSQ